MTALETSEVDPFDDAALEACHATYDAAHRAVLGDAAQPFTLPEVRAMLQHPTSDVLIGFVPWTTGGLRPAVVPRR